MLIKIICVLVYANVLAAFFDATGWLAVLCWLVAIGAPIAAYVHLYCDHTARSIPNQPW